MIIKLKFSILLTLFLISNIISTMVMLIPQLAIFSLTVNFICIIYLTIYLFNKIPRINNKKPFLYVYSIWVILMIINGLSLEIRLFGRLFSNPEFAIILFFPLLIYVPFTKNFFSKLIKFILIFNFIYLVMIVIFYFKFTNDVNIYEFISKRFAFANSFLLLIFGFLSRKKKIICLIIFFISILFALIFARRAQLFYIVMSLLFAWGLYVFYFKKTYILINALLGILLFCSIFIFNVDKMFESNFSILINRINDDTRSTTESDFSRDMSTIDWIIGKGINGRFKTSQLIDLDYEGDSRSLEDKQYRYGIETGYLNIILKGGIIKLTLDLLIIGYAIFMGLFFGRNLMVKAAVFFLLLYLSTLYPENANSFTLRYLLVWISVAICLNKKIRKLNNSQFYNQYLYDANKA
ncbi:O-antigen polymerase [Empedobacter sp.]|uniref:O-antigen polymerase n=1 Tax=Empedobacter sp. TaxID=1927715 RepID=UPI0028A5F84E|nr:O-antigen polymerase [Empedobacter sp.]